MLTTQGLVGLVGSLVDYTDNILAEDVVNLPVEAQKDWLLKTGQILNNWTKVESTSCLKQAKILWHVWAVWDADNNLEGHFISTEAKGQWNYDYYKWAKSFTKKTQREPANITIDNKAKVYRDWVAEEIIEYPEVVFVPIRDDTGQCDDIDNPDNWEMIEFHPEDCDYSKLLVCRATARAGEMSPDAWTALRDPWASVEELKSVMSAGRSSNNGTGNDDFHVYEDNGIIYASEGGTSVAVMQTIFENRGELFDKAFCHILRSVGLKPTLSYQ